MTPLVQFMNPYLGEYVSDTSLRPSYSLLVGTVFVAGILVGKIPIKKIFLSLKATYDKEAEAIAEKMFTKRVGAKRKQKLLSERAEKQELRRERRSLFQDALIPFRYVFHGRELKVGDLCIVNGLSNTAHTLEIVQKKLYLDNKPYPSNEGDIPRIKAALEELKASYVPEPKFEIPPKKPRSTFSSKSRTRQPQNAAGNTSGMVHRAGLLSRPKPQVTETVKSESLPLAVPSKAPIPKPTQPLEKPFEHTFFGTSLTVGDLKIATGLNNSAHRMEIVGNQMYLDNLPYTINQGDIERVKEMIRKLRIYG